MLSCSLQVCWPTKVFPANKASPGVQWVHMFFLQFAGNAQVSHHTSVRCYHEEEWGACLDAFNYTVWQVQGPLFLSRECWNLALVDPGSLFRWLCHSIICIVIHIWGVRYWLMLRWANYFCKVTGIEVNPWAVSRTGEQHFNPVKCRITQIFGENPCGQQDIKRKVSEVLVLHWAMLLVLSI